MLSCTRRFLLVPALFAALVVSNGAPPPLPQHRLAALEPCLYSGAERPREFASFAAPTLLCLEGLHPHGRYEVKISLPISPPARLHLAIRQAANVSAHPAAHVAAPRILAARDEKITFWLDGAGRVAGGAGESESGDGGGGGGGTGDGAPLLARAAVEVLVERESVERLGAPRAVGVHFHAVLDDVWLVVLPSRLARLAPAFLVTLVAIACGTTATRAFLEARFP